VVQHLLGAMQSGTSLLSMSLARALVRVVVQRGVVPCWGVVVVVAVVVVVRVVVKVGSTYVPVPGRAISAMPDSCCALSNSGYTLK